MVRRFEKRVRGRSVRPVKRDADACRYRRGAAVQFNGTRYDGDDIGDQHLKVLPRADVFQQYGKLVATEPRHDVGGPRSLPQAGPDLDQQSVAGVMAQFVVDALEAVQVNEQHGETFVASRARAMDCAMWSYRRRRLGRPVKWS